MDWPLAAVAIVAIVTTGVGYVVYTTRRAAKENRAVSHIEFDASLEPTHRERMASIAAQRDAEIAKATRRDPVKTIEH